MSSIYLNNRKTFSSNNLSSANSFGSINAANNFNQSDPTTTIPTFPYSNYNSNSNNNLSSADHKKDAGFLSMWQQRHQRLSHYGIIKNSPYYSACLICSLLIILSSIILMSVVLFVLNDEEMDQFKIGIYSLLSSRNDRNDWHLKYSTKSDQKFLKFIVFGDWGRKGHFNQSIVAEQMGIYCKNFGCDFVLSTGDNFYQEGVKSVEDPLFRESFENVYTHESLKNIPFLSALGNHDYRSNPGAQIQYTNHPSSSKRLYIQSEYFSETMYFPEKRIQLLSKDGAIDGENLIGNFDFRVQFLFFDTNPFIRKYFTHPKMNKEALHKTRDIRAQQEYMETVMKQLDENIASGEEDAISYFVNSERSRTNILRKYVNEFEKKKEVPLWKIAIGHHPFYSASTHGDNENLIEHLMPFLRKHDIRYYFSGHDHSIQYLKPYETLNQFISGAGSAVRFDVSEYHPYLKKYQQESGFIYVRLSRDVMELSFVNLFGRVTERIKIPRE